jgi:hypothetical protein
MDTLQLYSEKIRRTALRVKVRSNYHLKKMALKIVKNYLERKEEKKANELKAMEFLKAN